MTSFSHIDDAGAARMVDVSGKAVTARTASASGRVLVADAVIALLRGAGVPKGDTLAVARLAGIMGAKQTPSLIPLCHPLALTKVEVEITPDHDLPGLVVHATARLTGQTGVEMEALTAVSVACLTIYDMVKAADRGMRIEGIRLLAKDGGKSGSFRAEP